MYNNKAGPSPETPKPLSLILLEALVAIERGDRPALGVPQVPELWLQVLGLEGGALREKGHGHREGEGQGAGDDRELCVCCWVWGQGGGRFSMEIQGSIDRQKGLCHMEWMDG
jgi:hypothetical protein